MMTPTADDKGNGPGGWQEYRRLVLEALRRIDAELAEIKKNLDARDQAGIARWETLEAKRQADLKELEQVFVTRREFVPIRSVIYGIVGVAGTALVMAILSRVLT